MKVIYEAMLPEPTDGRGTVSGGFFSTHAEAARRADDGNICGSPARGSVAERIVYESYTEWQGGQKAEARRRALAKLTTE